MISQEIPSRSFAVHLCSTLIQYIDISIKKFQNIYRQIITKYVRKNNENIIYRFYQSNNESIFTFNFSTLKVRLGHACQ